MGYAFAKITFKKLYKRQTVASNGYILLKELSTEALTSVNAKGFDLSLLGLPAGTYTIAATSLSSGLESNPSNSVIYIVN